MSNKPSSNKVRKRTFQQATVSETSGQPNKSAGVGNKKRKNRSAGNGEESKQQKRIVRKKNRKRFWKMNSKNPAENQPKDQQEINSKSVVKTMAIYSKANPSSNWKNLIGTICINGDKKKNVPKVKANLTKNAETKKQVSKDVTGRNSDEKGTSTDKPNQEFDVWFDDVDEELLQLNKMPTTIQPTKSHSSSNNIALAKPGNFSGCTKTVAMDCEMVGVGDGGKEHELARVSIVNRLGHTVYDKFVKPREDVVDYRTHVSGVRPSDLENAEEFSVVQKEVYDIIKGRILIGHAIQHDLKVLYLSHSKSKIRDTSKYEPFRKLFNGRTPSLKKLSEKVLGVEVQSGEHNSIEDAQAAMRLYTMHRTVWEKELKLKRERKSPKKEKDTIVLKK